MFVVIILHIGEEVRVVTVSNVFAAADDKRSQKEYSFIARYIITPRAEGGVKPVLLSGQFHLRSQFLET